MRTRKPIQALSYVEELKQIFYKHGNEAMCDRLSEIAKSHIKEVDKILRWFKEIPQTTASGSYAEKYLAEFEVERKRLAYIDYLACQSIPTNQVVDIAAGTMFNFFPWIKAFKPQVVSGTMGIKSSVAFYFPAYPNVVFESPAYVKMESALQFSNQQFLFIGFNPSDSLNFKPNKEGLYFSKAFPANAAFFAHDFVSLIHVLRANDIEGAEYIVLKVGEDGSIHPDTDGYVSTDPDLWFEKLNGPGTLASVMHWFDRTNPAVEPAYAKIEGMILENPEGWNEKAQKCADFLKSQSSVKLEDALKSFNIEPNAENMQRFIAYLTTHEIILKTKLYIDTHFRVSIVPKAPKWIKEKGIASLKNMVSKDTLNPGATGVFFEGRRMVATDKRKIVIVPTTQKEFKGKIIDIKTKSVIDASYPDYKSILKYDFQLHSLPIPIDDFTAKVNGANQSLKSVETAMKAIDFVLGHKHFNIHPTLLLDTLLAMKANGAAEIVVSVFSPQDKTVVMIRLDGDNGTIGLIAALNFREGDVYDPWDLIKTEPFKINLPQSETTVSETQPAIFLPQIQFGEEISELSAALESLRVALEFSDEQASIQEAIAALETAMEFA